MSAASKAVDRDVAYVSILQHTSAYVSVCGRQQLVKQWTAYVSVCGRQQLVKQWTAYVSVCGRQQLVKQWTAIKAVLKLYAIEALWRRY
jgi:RNA polymerase subunit RPABC4/transcription elongation factor Spt4